MRTRILQLQQNRSSSSFERTAIENHHEKIVNDYDRNTYSNICHRIRMWYVGFGRSVSRVHVKAAAAKKINVTSNRNYDTMACTRRFYLEIE